MFLPSVIESNGNSSKAYDLPTKLLTNRVVYLSGAVTEESANAVIMQLLWLNADKPKEDIHLYINSPGGSVYQGLGIKDVIDSLDCKVNTVGIAMCASMGAYLLAAGTGERKAMKNCRIMLHSVSSGTSGTIHDMSVDYEETNFLQNVIMKDISKFTGNELSVEEVSEMCKRDYYVSASNAVKMKLIDRII